MTFTTFHLEQFNNAFPYSFLLNAPIGPISMYLRLLVTLATLYMLITYSESHGDPDLLCARQARSAAWKYSLNTAISRFAGNEPSRHVADSAHHRLESWWRCLCMEFPSDHRTFGRCGLCLCRVCHCRELRFKSCCSCGSVCEMVLTERAHHHE